MTTNEQSRNEEVSRGIYSQADINALRGGQAKSLPSVPAPGRPGSRFNPVVVSREERAARQGAEQSSAGQAPTGTGGKSLGNGLRRGVIQSVPQQIMNARVNTADTEAGVVSAATQGFVGGVVAGAQAQGLPPVGPGASKVDDALPGLDQPIAASVIDALQGNSPAGGKKVVMRPEHLAGLAEIDRHQDESLDHGDSWDRR